MSWIKEKWGLWGDTSQDEVNDHLESEGFQYTENYTKQKLIKFKKRALQSATLRKRFNSVFQEAHNREATKRELVHHLNIGLRL